MDEDSATATATATATPSPNTVTGHVDVSSTNEASAKRRKVRKGTRSCWECKRRKIRCMFASTEHVTCIGCQHRRAPCVTQDMPEELAPAKKGNRHLSDRIARVEDFMKEYLATKHVGVTNHAQEQSPQDRRRPSSDVLADRPTYLTPKSDQASHKNAEVPYSSGLTRDTQEDSGHDEIQTARDSLWAAFPPEGDAEILLRESFVPSLYTELVKTQSHSKLTREALSRPYSTAELPGPKSHPVILAKFMLTFAITLQSPTGKKIVGLSEPQSVLERRLTMAATRWVTTNGDLHGTVECLICIILEGAFEINRGNLRRAWAVYRRALTVAQLMGLHRSPMPALKRINPEVDVDPDSLWFRIVYMDRYLSLLLGLPQGTSDTRMGAASGQQHEPPLGRFERSITVIASRILDRNESSFTTSEIATTQAIDSELLQVSRSMPASFWRPANFHNLTPESPDTLLESVRLSAQVYYYGLSIQLHLPYTMAWEGNTAHEYSKTTCVNASREIMTRFIAHRTFNPTSSCSRPVDFWALLAGMTLVLAHLDAHHHQDLTNSLAHQRSSDRAMLEHALEKMHVISNSNKDPISQKSAKLLRRLLDIEADAAEGTSYTTRSVRGDIDAQEDKDEGSELRLHIPYLGVIKIARQGPICREHYQRHPATAPNSAVMFPPHASPTDQQPSSYVSPGNQAPEYEQYGCPSEDDIGLRSQEGLPPVMAGVDDWAFQGVDTAFFDSLMRGTPSIDAAALEQQWMEDCRIMDSGLEIQYGQQNR